MGMRAQGDCQIKRNVASFLEKYFNFWMSLSIAVVVAYGFIQTLGKTLIHATPPRPLVLYVHGAAFFGSLFSLAFSRRWYGPIGFSGIGW